MMNSSFLYHAWGLYGHKCSGVEYKGNTIILHIETQTPKKTSPECGSRHLVKNGYRLRDFIGLPIGGKKVILRMKVQRYKCKNKDCDYVRQETIPIVTDSCSLSIVLPGTWSGYWKRWFLEARKAERSWYQKSCYWPLCSVWILKWKIFYLRLYMPYMIVGTLKMSEEQD